MRGRLSIRTTGRRSRFMEREINARRWLPEDVLQEDSALLMYFDNAGMRNL
jgi:hypothetical protein